MYIYIYIKTYLQYISVQGYNLQKPHKARFKMNDKLLFKSFWYSV
jgi:hypothetical protein